MNRRNSSFGSHCGMADTDIQKSAREVKTMKTLLLMRHAKSDWGTPGLADHDRPLNARGMRAAPSMGQWLADNHLIPDVVLSSSATRTRETTELVTGIWTADADHQSPSIIIRSELYHAAPETLISEIQQLDDSANTALLIAHNPGMEELFAAITGRWEKYATAAIACFRLDVESWMEFHPGCASTLLHFIKPKELDQV